MVQTETIRTKDGNNISARIYRPSEDVDKVIVIAASADVTQSFYKDFAAYLLENKMAVITFDFRGVGASAPKELKGFEATLENWAQQDLDAILRHTKNLFPKQELILIGHGVGGEIIGLAPASQFVSRIILVNCALSCTRLRHWTDRIGMTTMKKFMKLSSWAFGYFPGKNFGILNNLPKGVLSEWINWCDNPNGLFDDLPDYNYRKFQVPLLALSFSDDWRSQEAGVKALLQHFVSASIQHRHINPQQAGFKSIGHSGFFRLNSKEKLWPLLLNWVEGTGTESLTPGIDH